LIIHTNIRPVIKTEYICHEHETAHDQNKDTQAIRQGNFRKEYDRPDYGG